MARDPTQDGRFARFNTDPKFRRLARKQRQVQIDERFQSMFQDPRFLNRVNVDKRGRPDKQSFSAQENYKRYYQLEDEGAEATPASERPAQARLADMSVDYARGEAVLESDSSSEADSSDDEAAEEAAEADPALVFDKWGELDHDAGATEEATGRLAVCHMDWDRVGAEDLFLALSSFLPASGRLRAVRVYLSDFGRERLAQEDRLGPEELRLAHGSTAVESDDDQPSDETETCRRAMERIRRYQVNRLKYYYAVAEFDSAEVANLVYEQCDGSEYELSATRFDLRFIPEDMAFEAEPTATCTSLPGPDAYRPKVFQTTALQQGKVELTWDESDPQRLAAMQRAFTQDSDDDDEERFKHLVAAASDSEAEAGGPEHREDDGEQASIGRYQALLAQIRNKERRQATDEADMEMTWTTSESQKAANEAAEANQTPWEQFLAKKKQKRDAKREKRHAQRQADEAESEAEDLPSDVDFDDPYFRDEVSVPKPVSQSQKKRDKKKKKDQAVAEEAGVDQPELNLLVMDSEDERAHFDYKDIVDRDTKKKKKKKGKKKRQSELTAPHPDVEAFTINLQDDRFAAVFNQPDYNVDPSHPSFKKTKSMQEIIGEKQRRILAADRKREGPALKASPGLKAPGHLDSLVKAIQAKTQDSDLGGSKKKKSKKKAQKRKLPAA